MMGVVGCVYCVLQIVIVLYVFCKTEVGANGVVIENEAKADYWRNLGQSTLQSALHVHKEEGVAKNVILFLGDGMGIPTITAMRIYKGQKAGKSGEEETLSFDHFPFVSLSKTYALDRQNPDSANTATAYLCGVKANYGTLGVDGRVMMDDCSASVDSASHVPSILQWAQEAGKWTGFVTSTRVTHATPAGLYSHCASRYWEASSPDDRCKDIATQMVRELPGRDIHVILGGGRSKFLPYNQEDIEGVKGERNDTNDLLTEWLQEKQSRVGQKAMSVFDLENFKKVDPNKTDYLLGLFNSDHLPYVADRSETLTKYPTLVELTEMAIRILSRNPKGFFLMVEGGRIDTAHHMNWALRALEEGVEFDEAIQAAADMTNIADTLITVTADHSHTFTISGDYPKRGNNILGLGGISDVDNLTMTTINYANGPGYKGSRYNHTEKEVLDKNYRQDAIFPMEMESHGAEDVAVYARGPMAHLFHGVHDQSYIPYVMGYASCIGPNKEHCSRQSRSGCNSFNPLSGLWLNVFVFILMRIYFVSFS